MYLVLLLYRLRSARFLLDQRPKPLFDLIIRWVESSDFGPKSDDLGHRILKSDFITSDFAKSDCISRPISFSDGKIKIRSSESDRMINGLTDALLGTCAMNVEIGPMKGILKSIR